MSAKGQNIGLSSLPAIRKFLETDEQKLLEMIKFSEATVAEQDIIDCLEHMLQLRLEGDEFDYEEDAKATSSAPSIPPLTKELAERARAILIQAYLQQKKQIKVDPHISSTSPGHMKNKENQYLLDGINRKLENLYLKSRGKFPIGTLEYSEFTKKLAEINRELRRITKVSEYEVGVFFAECDRLETTCKQETASPETIRDLRNSVFSILNKLLSSSSYEKALTEQNDGFCKVMVSQALWTTLLENEQGRKSLALLFEGAALLFTQYKVSCAFTILRYLVDKHIKLPQTQVLPASKEVKESKESKSGAAKPSPKTANSSSEEMALIRLLLKTVSWGSSEDGSESENTMSQFRKSLENVIVETCKKGLAENSTKELVAYYQEYITRDTKIDIAMALCSHHHSKKNPRRFFLWASVLLDLIKLKGAEGRVHYSQFLLPKVKEMVIRPRYFGVGGSYSEWNTLIPYLEKMIEPETELTAEPTSKAEDQVEKQEAKFEQEKRIRNNDLYDAGKDEGLPVVSQAEIDARKKAEEKEIESPHFESVDDDQQEDYKDDALPASRDQRAAFDASSDGDEPTVSSHPVRSVGQYYLGGRVPGRNVGAAVASLASPSSSASPFDKPGFP